VLRKLAVAAVLAVAALAPAGVQAAEPGIPPFEERAALFDYDPSTLAITVFSVEDKGFAKVWNVVYDTAGGPSASAYVVVPTGTTRAGVLFAHWLSAHPTANRTEFLDDALALARRGAASILPSGFFPWVPNPEGDATDAARIVSEVVMQRRALDVLEEFGATGPFAVVGHDYGGMYGSITAVVDDRVSTEVLMAVDATFSNWFDRYWLGLTGPAETAYQALLAPYDPINYVDHAPAGAWST